jgi:hypothetical protein
LVEASERWVVRRDLPLVEASERWVIRRDFKAAVHLHVRKR